MRSFLLCIFLLLRPSLFSYAFVVLFVLSYVFRSIFQTPCIVAKSPSLEILKKYYLSRKVSLEKNILPYLKEISTLNYAPFFCVNKNIYIAFRFYFDSNCVHNIELIVFKFRDFPWKNILTSLTKLTAQQKVKTVLK